jgi:hypothetical protein
MTYFDLQMLNIWWKLTSVEYHEYVSQLIGSLVVTTLSSFSDGKLCHRENSSKE